jgi:hypothetical protein
MDKLGRGVATALVMFAAMILSGCGTRYLTPSGPADLSKLSNSSSGIKDAFKANKSKQEGQVLPFVLPTRRVRW